MLKTEPPASSKTMSNRGRSLDKRQPIRRVRQAHRRQAQGWPKAVIVQSEATDRLHD
jgi:hypothetical protein